MAAVDLWIRDMITAYGSVLIILPVIIFALDWLWTKLAKSIYRLHLVGFEAESADLAQSYKRQLFAPLNVAYSNDQVLRSLNVIRVLEIGVKTGRSIENTL